MSPSSYRVFLSYSHRDEDFVTKLYQRLTLDGVSCFFDKKSIRWGDNWVLSLERGLRECEHVVFVLSPDFCGSEWAQIERSSAFADSRLREKVRPLMLHPCRELPTFPFFLKAVQTIDVSTTVKFEENYPQICRDLGGEPRNESVAVDRTKLPPVQPLPQRHCLRLQSMGDKFIGRVEAIWSLYDSLFRDSTTVLQGTGVVAGTGGLGKSQLAIEYAHRFGNVYRGGVYWVAADRGLGPMVSDIAEAADISVETKTEEPKQLEQIWHGLHSLNAPCLVILDNFPEDGELAPYLPPTGRIHTIVTTRRRDLGQTTVGLSPLSLSDGARLLNSGDRDLGAEAEALAESLGGLPLALELAKGYLNYRQDLTLADLIRELKSAGEIPVLAEFCNEYRNQLPSGHERDVVQTFGLSWEITSESARQILRVMGELAPAAVPRALLRSILHLPQATGLKDGLGKGLSELRRLSWVDLDSSGDPVAHRLVLAFLRHRNGVDDASPFAACVAAVQEEMQLSVAGPDAQTMRRLERMVVHAEWLLAQERLSAAESGDLASRLGIHHRSLGRFTAARHWHSTALAADEKSYEAGHPSTARRQSNLALVLQDLGELGEARDLLRKALAADEKSYEAGHPSIAIRQSNLALVLQDLGESGEARDLLRKALAADEKSYEAGHPSIAIRQSNLALVLKDLGELGEARDLLRKALTAAEKSYEAGHPSIAIRQSNLALVLQDLGELGEARDLLRKALAAAEKSYEAGHPSIAIGQSNLALVLQDLGELGEARDLLRKALAAAEKSYEAGHPSIAIGQSNLALVLQDLGELGEARDLLRKALAAAEKSYEAGHPSIAIGQSNLALVLQDLGELGEARDLLRKALAAAEKSYEAGHPSIARRQSNLALVLKDLGELGEARDLLRKALAADEKSYEAGHPSIARSQSNLALVLKDLGELGEARDLLRKAYSASLERYGPDHPNTKIFRGNINGLPKG